MQAPLLTFRVAGFVVHVDPFFLFLVGYISLSNVQAQDLAGALGWAIALPLGVLVHELGHASVARAFRLEVGAIELYGLGGRVTHGRTTPLRQLAISLAGPFAGFALGLATVALGMVVSPGGGPLVDGLVWPMLTVTFVYGLLNLLPAFPLDGGNALRAALASLFSDRVGLGVTSALGVLVGFAGIVYAMGNSEIWLGMLALYLTWTNLQVVQGLLSR